MLNLAKKSPGGAVFSNVGATPGNPNKAAIDAIFTNHGQPLGFDLGLASYPNNGVQIRVSSQFESASGADDTELLDMTPGSAGGFGDAALLAGQTYTDSTYGISVSVPSVSATLATVHVSSASLTATSTALASSVNPAAVARGS